MSTFMDINMAMRPVNGGLSQTSGGQNRLARMIKLDTRPVGVRMAVLLS